MKIKISTDSTADIPVKFCEELNISVLPLIVRYQDKEYRDGIDITSEEMFKILESCTTMPTSAQVAMPLYTELFEKTYNEGYTDLVHTTINAKGSGTYQTAILSKNMFFEDHPEAEGKFNIHIIDSGTYSMAYGLGVIEAATLVKQGADVQTVLDAVNDWMNNARALFVPLDLKCVKKSGRVSAAAAFVGDAMGLKPLLSFENGESVILGKIRGEKKVISAVVDLFLKERKPGSIYALAHGNNMEVFANFKNAVAEVADISPISEYPVGTIIGINTGPNLIGILYRK